MQAITFSTHRDMRVSREECAFQRRFARPEMTPDKQNCLLSFSERFFHPRSEGSIYHQVVI
jgi:hypothetical protein